MLSKPYRWVQVVTSCVKSANGNLEFQQLIGTTESEDKTHGLDDLIYRHRFQIGDRPVLWSSICYLNSDGLMSSQMMEGDRNAE